MKLQYLGTAAAEGWPGLFSHNGAIDDQGKVWLHEKLAPFMAERGFMVSYDGMAVDNDENGVSSYYQCLVRLRREIDVITEGDYTLLLPDDPWLFAYQRTMPGQRLTVLCGFNGEEADGAAALPFCKGRLMLGNYSEANGAAWRPYEARVYLEEGDGV